MEENQIPPPQANSDDEYVLNMENILMETLSTNNNDRTRKTIEALNDELKDMMQAINKYGEDGKITLTLKFKVDKGNRMRIFSEIETKKPKGKADGTTMYRDNKGRLFLDDPNQTHLVDVRQFRN